MSNTNITPQALFGPGVLWLTRTDVDGATPTNIGFVNEFSIDMSFDTKQLFGQNQFPLMAARGTGKCTGKMKAAALSGQALNSILIGGTWTSGTQYDAVTTESTPVAGSVTPVVPNAGTWDKDLGVVDADTNEPFILNALTAPNAGEYSVAAGVYTFNVADVGRNFRASYAFTYLGAAGQTQVIANNPIGTTPTFQLDYKNALNGSTYYLRLFRAVGSKFKLDHKITDYAMPEYDFEFYADSAQNLGIISLATQA